MLLRIIAILFPLFAIVAVGFVVGRRTRPDLSHANKLNMDVFVPALVFAALASKPFRPENDIPLLLATVVMVVASGLAAWALARAVGVAPKTLVPPVMFNNSGNLGLPLAVLAFGEQALAPFVVMFMASNLLHFSFGAWLLDHRVRLMTIWKVPSVLATFAGLAVGMSGVVVWEPLLMSIRMLGEISIPLMLFALGVRLSDSRITSIGLGVFGAIARPLIGMAIAGLLLMLVDFPPQQQALILIFGALPPAVLNYIFAERYHQEPEKVASMVLIGNLAAVVFLPIALAFVLP
ncbi:AEC family transporter [Denitromonas ohlonensis]|uniref:AEC family transporter n=2 Tax=Denitromonas TaxID=139331 RepID=A0A557SL51_9RHOO|nr:AEC family transporter [Denitromonas ohlonensis]TVO68025.1 AEC family transporter [Denitromonas ohlonensis]TVO78070.1 AEC family transporter [Denitromonas ohlonensis]